MKYDIIYADPPWRNPKSGTKKFAEIYQGLSYLQEKKQTDGMFGVMK